MTLNGTIMELVMMRENPMMPAVFKSSLDKVIETVSECEEPEHKKGEWILADRDDVPTGLMLRCSECNWEEHSNNAVYYSFCPNCGADMRGEEE